MSSVQTVTHVSGMDRANIERPAGIEPAPRAWEAHVLPLYYGRDAHHHLKMTDAAEIGKAFFDDRHLKRSKAFESKFFNCK